MLYRGSGHSELKWSENKYRDVDGWHLHRISVRILYLLPGFNELWEPGTLLAENDGVGMNKRSEKTLCKRRFNEKQVHDKYSEQICSYGS